MERSRVWVKGFITAVFLLEETQAWTQARPRLDLDHQKQIKNLPFPLTQSHGNNWITYYLDLSPRLTELSATDEAFRKVICTEVTTGETAS